IVDDMRVLKGHLRSGRPRLLRPRRPGEHPAPAGPRRRVQLGTLPLDLRLVLRGLVDRRLGRVEHPPQRPGVGVDTLEGETPIPRRPPLRDGVAESPDDVGGRLPPAYSSTVHSRSCRRMRSGRRSVSRTFAGLPVWLAAQALASSRSWNDFTTSSPSTTSRRVISSAL